MNDHKVTIDWVGRHKYKALARLRQTMHYGSHIDWRSFDECNLFRNDDMWDGQMFVNDWVAGPETARDVGGGK
jgi:hypothetical protein